MLEEKEEEAIKMQSALTELKNFNESFEVIGESTKALATISEVLGDAKTKSSILAPILEKTKEISGKILDFVGFGEEIENKATRKTITSVLSLLLLGGLLLWIFRKNIFSRTSLSCRWIDVKDHSPVPGYRYYVVVRSSKGEERRACYAHFTSTNVWQLWSVSDDDDEEEGFSKMSLKETVTHFCRVNDIPQILPLP